MKNIRTTIILFLMVGAITSCGIRETEPYFSETTSMTTESIPSSIPPSIIPTVSASSIVVMKNGITWEECIVPFREYSHSKPDFELLSRCMDMPTLDSKDYKMLGKSITTDDFSDLRLVIGNDVYETIHHRSNNKCCDYQLLKNGRVIVEKRARFITFDPNKQFWNIGGKLVWELIAQPPVIVVDGVDLNEEYQLEGSYFPYEISDKLIFIAKKNEK